MNNNIVKLIKVGKFYNVFGNDSIIIHFLLGYKIVPEKGGTGFPEVALNKVCNTLEDNNISYEVLEKAEIILQNDFNKINEYQKIYKKAIKKLTIEHRLNKIESKLKNMNQNNLRIF